MLSLPSQQQNNNNLHQIPRKRMYLYRLQECTSSEIKNVQQAIYKKKIYIYEQQEEEILNNLVLVSLTRTEYEYRCVFQQLIYFMHH